MSLFYYGIKLLSGLPSDEHYTASYNSSANSASYASNTSVRRALAVLSRSNYLNSGLLNGLSVSGSSLGSSSVSSSNLCSCNNSLSG